jgi:hypothetical protein
VETLDDRIRKPYVASLPPEAMTPEAGLIAYIQYDEGMSKEILIVLNLETLDKHQIYPEDSVVGFRWNKSGDKLAFLSENSRLGVYSIVEGKIIQIKELTGYDLRWSSRALEWTDSDWLILRKLEGDVSSICLLDKNLPEQKAIRLPFTSYYPAPIWIVGKYAVVENTENYQLWGVDLTTEKWLRIY